MEEANFKELALEAELSVDELQALCDGVLKYGMEYGEKYLERKLREKNKQFKNTKACASEKENKINPSHYKMKNGVECFDVMLDIFGREAVYDFCLCNAFKYLFRVHHKDTEDINIKKAQWYINKAVDLKPCSNTATKA